LGVDAFAGLSARLEPDGRRTLLGFRVAAVARFEPAGRLRAGAALGVSRPDVC